MKEAHYAAQELRSLDETLKTVEGRLYAIPGARTHGTSAGVVDPDYKERLMDRHGELKEKLSVARIRVSAPKKVQKGIGASSAALEELAGGGVDGGGRRAS